MHRNKISQCMFQKRRTVGVDILPTTRDDDFKIMQPQKTLTTVLKKRTNSASFPDPDRIYHPTGSTETPSRIQISILTSSFPV